MNHLQASTTSLAKEILWFYGSRVLISVLGGKFSGSLYEFLLEQHIAERAFLYSFIDQLSSFSFSLSFKWRHCGFQRAPTAKKVHSLDLKRVQFSILTWTDYSNSPTLALICIHLDLLNEIQLDLHLIWLNELALELMNWPCLASINLDLIH